jgi:hypothetical protein
LSGIHIECWIPAARDEEGGLAWSSTLYDLDHAANPSAIHFKMSNYSNAHYNNVFPDAGAGHARDQEARGHGPLQQ